MKTYTVRAVLLYGLALALACFLNLDKLVPWYEHKTMDFDSPVVQTLHAAADLRQASGVAATVDAFDCSTAFLFNDTYKDNSKCYDLDSSAHEPALKGLRRAWLAMSPAERSLAAQVVRQLLAQGAGMSPRGAVVPVADSGLAVASTGSNQASIQHGLKEFSGASQQQETPQKLPPRSVLIVGDSLALGLSTSFEQALKEYNENIAFARVGKVSSGLAIPHLFDWEKKVQVLIEKYKPDLIVVLMGINDANNNIRVDDRKAILGTAAWPDAYQERVKRFIDIIAERNVPIYWVGLPVVRDEAMTQRIEIANSAARKACDAFAECHFINTWNILTDDKGNYTNYKKDDQGYTIRIRAQDGVHFSREGGDLLSRHILDFISQFVQLRPASGQEASI